MQLAFDAADRLVELVEVRRGPVPAEEAAQALYALRHVPLGLARSLLADVVDGDARLAWRGASVGLAEPPGAALALEDATYVVVDLETTGLSPGSSAICEIGAVRVRGLELVERFETLVNPRRPLPAPIAALTGIDPRALRGAPPVELAVRRFLDFAGDAVLVAHNARFDIGFLDREVERLTGPPDRGARRRHGLARAAAARGPPEARRRSPRSRTSSARRRGRATERSPTRRRPPRSCSR